MSTDEEQLEDLKRWWSENGNFLMIAVALVMVVFFGWRQFGNSRVNHSSEASDLYQQVLNLAGDLPASEISEEDVSTVTYLNDQLREDYDDTVYSRYSALFMAKLYAGANDLDKAEQELSWVLDNPDLGMFTEVEEAMLMTARGRLARVILAKGDAQRALALLTAVEPGDFLSTFAEIEGDVYVALEQPEQARAAYEKALEAGNASALIEIKLSGLGG